MTSSSGTDWFPPVQDCSKKQRITVELSQLLVEKIEVEAEEQDRSIAGQIRFVLKKHFLNKGNSLQNFGSGLDCARRDGAGEGGSTGCSNTTDNLPLQHFDHSAHESSKAVSPLLNSFQPKERLGKESEETPLTKSKLWKKEFPPCLEEFSTQIADFWKEKKGAKSERAWNLLMKELSAIHAHLNVSRSPSGRETFLEQLELATANRFQSITLKNFRQFAEGTPGKAPEPELKHPASQVFKASDMNWPSVGGNQ